MGRQNYDRRHVGSDRVLNNMRREATAQDKFAQQLITNIVRPVGAAPLQLPLEVRRGTVNSIRFTYPGPDAKGAQAVFGGTAWHPNGGAGLMCFTAILFGHVSRPAMLLVDAARYSGTYQLYFYDPSTTQAGTVLDTGSPTWAMLKGVRFMSDATGPDYVYPKTYDFSAAWNVSCALGTDTCLHGKNMPIGMTEEDTDVIFLQTGDVITFAVDFPGTPGLAKTTGTLTLADVTFSFTLWRATPKGGEMPVANIEFRKTIQSNISTIPSVSHTYTVPATISATGMGHYFLYANKVTVENNPIGAYVPTNGFVYKILLTPAASGPKFALIGNPLIDPALRGDPELGRMARTTAASMLVSPGAMAATGVGSLECYRCEWDDSLVYSSLANNTMAMPAITGAYTYLPVEAQGHTAWTESVWGAGTCYRYNSAPAHVVNLVGNTTNAAVGYGLTIEMIVESESRSTRVPGRVSNVPIGAVDEALRLILSKQEYFMENPSHLRKIWDFLKDTGAAIWRGARVVAPYVAPAIATVNPEAAIIMEAFSRLIGA